MKIKQFKNKEPMVLIHTCAMNKMREYVKQCSLEIGWLGTVYRLDACTYSIHDVFLFSQDVHATTTEITEQGLGDFAQEVLQKGEEGLEIWNNMKMWGHSHVNMGVSPSGQDDKQMDFFETSGHDFFIRIIMNKKNDIKIDIYDYEIGVIYEDVKHKIVYEDGLQEMVDQYEEQIKALQVAIKNMTEISENEIASIKTEIGAKVKEKKWSYSTPSKTPNSWYDSYDYGYGNNSWWKDEIEEKDKVKKKEVVETTIDYFSLDTAEEVFSLLSETDIYELQYIEEYGEGMIEYIEQYDLSKKEREKLGYMIEDFTLLNELEYKNYILKEMK